MLSKTQTEMPEMRNEVTEMRTVFSGLITESDTAEKKKSVNLKLQIQSTQTKA